MESLGGNSSDKSRSVIKPAAEREETRLFYALHESRETSWKIFVSSLSTVLYDVIENANGVPPTIRDNGAEHDKPLHSFIDTWTRGGGVKDARYR